MNRKNKEKRAGFSLVEVVVSTNVINLKAEDIYS